MQEYAYAPTTARRPRRRRALVAILLASSLATLGAGTMSLAVFTDTDASSGAWSTGTIVLGVSPTAAFNASNIFPGDSGSRTITVQNTGTGDLRYAIEGVATDLDAKGLAAKLDFAIDAGACGSTTGSLYSAKLSGVAVGSKAQGGQAGDREVLAGASEQLCFSWSLDRDSTGNAYQNAGTGAVFTFYAEQTKNN